MDVLKSFHFPVSFVPSVLPHKVKVSIIHFQKQKPYKLQRFNGSGDVQGMWEVQEKAKICVEIVQELF
jgi:hypothetical protein